MQLPAMSRARFCRGPEALLCGTTSGESSVRHARKHSAATNLCRLRRYQTVLTGHRRQNDGCVDGCLCDSCTRRSKKATARASRLRTLICQALFPQESSCPFDISHRPLSSNIDKKVVLPFLHPAAHFLSSTRTEAPDKARLFAPFIVIVRSLRAPILKQATRVCLSRIPLPSIPLPP